MGDRLLIRSSVRAVGVARLANVAFAAAVIAGLAASIALGDRFVALLLGADAARSTSMLAATRWTLLLGLAIAACIHVFLGALGRILRTVHTGDPFVDANAGRLRTIGAALLALQALNLPAAAIEHAYPGLGAAGPSADLAPAGWLAVLMAFVLARVFEAGARMREDLDGTV